MASTKPSRRSQHPDRLNSLSFAFRPSPESNDHQVRILIDGRDWISDRSLGLDPPEFFAQRALAREGRLLLGRCSCGCVGCDDVVVEVQRADGVVSWIESPSTRLRFDADAFDRVVAAGRADTSWEDVNRTAERLVEQVLKGMAINDEFHFVWASARIEKRRISLSFDGPKQKIVSIRWDGVSPASAVESARRFRATRR